MKVYPVACLNFIIKISLDVGKVAWRSITSPENLFIPLGSTVPYCTAPVHTVKGILPQAISFPSKVPNRSQGPKLEPHHPTPLAGMERARAPWEGGGGLRAKRGLCLNLAPWWWQETETE